MNITEAAVDLRPVPIVARTLSAFTLTHFGVVAGQGVVAVSRFLTVARFAHEKQAAGAVGLDTGLDVAKEGLACGAGDFATVQDEGALAAGVGLGQKGAMLGMSGSYFRFAFVVIHGAACVISVFTLRTISELGELGV